MILERIDSGEMFQVSDSISANTGVAPQYKTQFADAAKVMGETMT